MKDFEFYRKYANMPLEKRKIIFADPDKLNTQLTANYIYHEVKRIDDKIRKDVIIKERLIKAFENKFF